MKIKTRRYYIYYMLKMGIFLARFIPRDAGIVIADFAGRVVFRVLEKFRNIAISNLNQAFSSDHQRNRLIARDVFRNLAKTGVDWIKLSSFSGEDIDGLVTEISGGEYLDRVLSEGRGAILLASHFGNWELLSFYLSVKGYKGCVVAKRIYFYKYDKFITRLRNRFGVNVVYRDESPKRLLKTLKRNEILGMLADQDVDSVEGIFVDFFGKPTYTPTAPAKLKMSSGAGLIPVFTIRKPDNTYKIVMEEPLALSLSGNREKDVKLYTQAWTDVLERYIRQYPEQWAWIHRRWKTKPHQSGDGK